MQNTIDRTLTLDNPIFNADSYKTSHFRFLEIGTTKVFSYIEARDGGEYDESVFFGLQYFLKRYMQTKITPAMIDMAEKVITAHGLPFNREGWEYIVKHYDGRLPLKIRAVKEGTLVPNGGVMVTVENTDPKCAWLSSYIETAMLRGVWYGTTVATRAYEFKKLIGRYLEETGGIEELPFKFIDFGARGASSKETAEIGGMAHQTSFMGTDNILGFLCAMVYYNIDEVPSFSIPATEHTVTIGWGEDSEKEFFENAIKMLDGEGTAVSVVSDTYDFDEALRIWGEDMKEKVLETKGTVVVRPDSGDPTEMVLKTLRTLDHYYGSDTNEQGYKVLNGAVRCIQGDGVNLEKVEEILETIKQAGYSAANVTFGCGGYLLQDLTRDTQRFAMKGSYIEVNGQKRDIRKTTITDPTKASKAGRLTLVKRWGVAKPITIREEDKLSTDTDLMETVFNKGMIMREQKFEDIRGML